MRYNAWRHRWRRSEPKRARSSTSVSRLAVAVALAAVVWAGVAWAQPCGGVGQLPCPPSAAVGVFLGDTGHDFVSPSPYMFGNRVMDWHVRVTGLRAVPVSATVLAFDA